MARRRMVLSVGSRVHVVQRFYLPDKQEYMRHRWFGTVWSYGTTAYRRWIIVDERYRADFTTLSAGCAEAPTRDMHLVKHCNGDPCRIGADT